MLRWKVNAVPLTWPGLGCEWGVSTKGPPPPLSEALWGGEERTTKGQRNLRIPSFFSFSVFRHLPHLVHDLKIKWSCNTATVTNTNTEWLESTKFLNMIIAFSFSSLFNISFSLTINVIAISRWFEKNKKKKKLSHTSGERRWRVQLVAPGNGRTREVKVTEVNDGLNSV